MMRWFCLLLLLVCQASAQRAPSPFWFANAVNPYNLSGAPVLWYNASSFSGVTNNAPVGTSNLTVWADSSNNGHPAVANGAAAQPVYNLAVINNRAAVALTNSASVTNNGVTLGGDFTIIAVVTNSNSDGYILGNLTVNRQVRLNRSGANVVSFFAGNAEAISSTFGSANTSLRCITFRRSGSTVSFTENQTARGSGTEGGSITINQVGNSTGAGGGSPRGFVGEIIVYNSSMSDAIFNSLYLNYLQPKWGLP
jgi:hypothetical protein